MDSSAAPISSISRVVLRMKPVILTMPPTWWAEIASCMVLRCIRPIFLPEIIVTVTATVTTPMPPIWISIRITAWPKADQ